MPAYVIVDIDVTDPEGYEAYKKAVPANLERYGGEYLCRGGETEVLEGEWVPKRLVMLQFESMDQARRWYNSADYQALCEVRKRTAHSRMLLVEGATP